MSFGETFLDFLAKPPAQAVLSTLALLFVLMIGYYVVQKFRGHDGNDRQTANELMTNFREMNREGEITDEEFRTIKTVLREPLKSEVKESSDEV